MWDWLPIHQAHALLMWSGYKICWLFARGKVVSSTADFWIPLVYHPLCEPFTPCNHHPQSSLLILSMTSYTMRVNCTLPLKTALKKQMPWQTWRGSLQRPGSLVSQSFMVFISLTKKVIIMVGDTLPSHTIVSSDLKRSKKAVGEAKFTLVFFRILEMEMWWYRDIGTAGKAKWFTRDLVCFWQHNGSSFANTDLDYQLKQRGITHVICAGMVANTCLEATARYATEL